MTDIEKKVIENYKSDTQYIEQIDKYYNKSLDRTKPILIGKTPNALVISGAKQGLDVIINPKTIDKCTGNPNKIYHGHELEKIIMEQLPEQLRNPIMILKNTDKNALVAITDLRDNENREIIIAIGLNRTVQRHIVNKIASVYGRNNFINYLNTQIQKGNLVAYNKEKANELFQSVGLRLPSEETIISYDDSISYTTENVKYPMTKIKERSENMQETKNEKIIEDMSFQEVIEPNQKYHQEEEIQNMVENKKSPIRYNIDNLQDINKVLEDEKSRIIQKVDELDNNSKNSVFEMLQQMSENGDIHAKNQIALAYYFGDGIDRDVDKAIEIFVEVAGDGNAVAQRNLAIIFENTEPTDQQKAVEYYKMAVENKEPDAYAINNLGACYLTGDGVESNPKKAVELFKKAADLGDDFAKINLADALFIGNGTRQNHKKAFELYKEVAENGNIDALKSLAKCYLEGKGTEVNYKLALECYQKATEKGDEDAKLKYIELENKLNPQKHIEVDNSTIKKILEDNYAKAMEKRETNKNKEKTEPNREQSKPAKSKQEER